MSAHKIGHQLHGAFVADSADVVDKEDVINLVFVHHLGQRTLIYILDVAIVHDVDILVVLHQEGGKGVAEGLLDEHDGFAILHLGILDHTEGVVTADEGRILGGGVPGAHVGDDIPIHLGAVHIGDGDVVGGGRNIGDDLIWMIL